MYKAYSCGKNTDTDRKFNKTAERNGIKMSKNKDGDKKQSFKKQLVSGGIYIALAAAIVTVTLGSVSNIMNGGFGYKAPDVELEDGTEKIVIPNLVGDTEGSDAEVSGVGKGVHAEVEESKDKNPVNEDQKDSPESGDKTVYPEQKPVEKPHGGKENSPENSASDGKKDTKETANSDVGEVSAEYPEDPEDALFDGRFYKVADGYICREYSIDELVYSPTMKDFRTHGGIDITGDMGSPVRLFTSGKITDIYDDASLGKTVAVDHGNGISALYSNLSCDLPQTTAVGAKLEGGAVIGAIGCTAATECADVSHVHLEITKDGERIDPKAYLSSEK